MLIMLLASMALNKPCIEPDVSTTQASTSTVVEVKEESSTEVQMKETQQSEYPEFQWSKDWGVEEDYLLAKIAMAEAEGEDVYTKTLVILTVLNRVHSNQFPDTIREVIFEQSNGVYQFSPVIPDGRWWTVEPNVECYKAVEMVKTAIYDYSEGATYFESCPDENNWHSRNLEFLYEVNGMRFYK